MRFASRNNALGFAARTRKNLDHIEKAYARNVDVHVITQLANSLLGLIVFPKEKNFYSHVKALELQQLEAQGWPQWQIWKGERLTLGDLVDHLRNAVAHGHMAFSSDDREPGKVTIEVEDYKRNAKVPYWCARIQADDLRSFCLKFIDLLENTIGMTDTFDPA